MLRTDKDRVAYILCSLSKQKGTGHFVRCCFLADLLARREQFRPLFISDQMDPNLVQEEIKARYPLVDASLIEWHSSDLLVVDSYDLPVELMQLAASAGVKTLLIDDICAEEQYAVDALLINNLALNRHDYDGKVTPTTRVFDGPEYFLIPERFTNLASQKKAVSVPPRNILLFFGGTDPFNLLTRILNMLEDRTDLLPDSSISIVIGKGCAHLDEVIDRARKREYTLYIDTPNMPELLATMDMAIGCGGMAMWERLCFAIPTVEFAHSSWQEQTFVRLAEQNLIHYAGYMAEMSDDKIWESIQWVMAGNLQIERHKFGGNLPELLDFLGSEKVEMQNE